MNTKLQLWAVKLLRGLFSYVIWSIRMLVLSNVVKFFEKHDLYFKAILWRRIDNIHNVFSFSFGEFLWSRNSLTDEWASKNKELFSLDLDYPFWNLHTFRKYICFFVSCLYVCLLLVCVCVFFVFPWKTWLDWPDSIQTYISHYG